MENFEKEEWFLELKWETEIRERSVRARDFKERFTIIREYYRKKLPDLIDRISRGYVPNPYFLEWQFTPIERNVWEDIRALGLPFYPQVPVLNYFIDFADPYHKIGIECDGKLWHNPEKDKIRDAALAKQGWTIYRFSGAKTFVNGKYFFDDILEDGNELYEQERNRYEAKFENESSEGFLLKLRAAIYWPEWEEIWSKRRFVEDDETGPF